MAARPPHARQAAGAPRALQQGLGRRPEQVSVALAPGVDANEIEGRGGRLDLPVFSGIGASLFGERDRPGNDARGRQVGLR